MASNFHIITYRAHDNFQVVWPKYQYNVSCHSQILSGYRLHKIFMNIENHTTVRVCALLCSGQVIYTVAGNTTSPLNAFTVQP